MSGANVPPQLADVARGDLRQWQGLPRGLTLDVVASVFPRAGAGEGRAPLGEGEAWFVSLEALDLAQRLRAWHDAGEVLLLHAVAPALAESAAELVERLGSPEARLDYDDGTIHVPAGEWVQAGLGLAAFLDAEATRLRHLALFPKASLEEYHARFRLHLRLQRRPLRAPRE